MRPLLPTLLASSAIGLIAQPAQAQALPDEPAIVVTGHGLEAPPATPAYDVTLIDADRLAQSVSGRIEDALGGIAGFQQFRRSDSRSSNPSAQGVTLRALGGNATSRALVLLDGVPMADPFFGYIPFSAIAPEQLSSARVTRGGGAGAFGAGAASGTIELTSGGPDQFGLLNASALIDDRGETELSGTLAPRLGSGFAALSGRWDRGEGFWTTPAAQRVPASAKARYDSWSASARMVAPLAPGMELQARLSAFDDRRTLRFAGAINTSSGQDASLRLVSRGAWQFDLLGYAQVRDFSSVVISSSTFRKSLDQFKTPTTGFGGKAELRPPLGPNMVLRIGGDWRVASGNEQEVAYNANLATNPVTSRRQEGGRNSDVGLFVENDWTVGPLVLTAGARADHWSISDGFFIQRNPAGTVTTSNAYPNRSDWEGSFRGGAVVAVGSGLKLRGAAYTGFRLPTLNELYRPFTVFPVTTQANAALTPEKLRGYEAGFDWTPLAPVKLSFTAFDNRVKQAVANVTIAANTRKRFNVDSIHARGLEFALNVASGPIFFDGSLALTDAKVVASGTALPLNGKRPAQTPEVAGSGTVGFHPAEGWTIAATLRHVGAQFEDDLQTDILPAATTLGVFVEVPISSGVSLVLRGENLTDTDVITRNQAGSIDLGAPRTLWAGLRFRQGR